MNDTIASKSTSSYDTASLNAYKTPTCDMTINPFNIKMLDTWKSNEIEFHI